MKRFLLWLIRLYQGMPGNWHSACRYQPTCSHYAAEAIERYGAWKGSLLAAKRLWRCSPWGGHGYDPVPLVYPVKHRPKKDEASEEEKSPEA